MTEPPRHVLDLNGSGFFSKGACTACDFEAKGHADEVRQRWQSQHPDGEAKVIAMPRRDSIPEPAEDPRVQRIERQMIFLLVNHVEGNTAGASNALLVAAGFAQSRAIMLGEEPKEGYQYVSLMVGRIAHLTQRARRKLCHPSRDRLAQQEILEGRA
jgi:hypothetical protein